VGLRIELRRIENRMVPQIIIVPHNQTAEGNPFRKNTGTPGGGLPAIEPKGRS
jgi:hypothetical protein